jgi:hypothetical protein
VSIVFSIPGFLSIDGRLSFLSKQHFDAMANGFEVAQQEVILNVLEIIEDARPLHMGI